MPPDIEFIIEAVLQSQGYVLARICEPTDFSLTTSATLNGVAIQPVLQQPRALAPKSGQLRHDLFAFVPANRSDIIKFKPNASVFLRP
jgi:hypothetical protein